MSAPRRAVLLLAVIGSLSMGLDASVGSAQMVPRASPSLGVPTHPTPTVYAEMQPMTQSSASTGKGDAMPNVAPHPDWPSPVEDQQNHLFFLADVLEYRPKIGGSGSANDYRWDIEGWYGGDYNRLWFKTEGQQNSAFKADYDVDSQLLYGRFIQQYYDFQVGGRLETQSFRKRNVTRGLAVIGLQGLVPYNYEVESALFVSHRGHVSARVTGTKDLFLSQRLILQLRFETNAAIQRVKKFTTGSGFNNVEGGARLRYEFRREFAPYVGVSLDRSFGETATLVRQEDGDTSQIRFVVGVRAWF